VTALPGRLAGGTPGGSGEAVVGERGSAASQRLVPGAAAPALCVIVPTYNERENIGPLVRGVFAALRPHGIPAEVLVVDDDSPDGTAGAARELAREYPVRVLVRRGERGLASAVLAGFSEARAAIVGVMDADLSHPAEALPALYEAVATGGAEIAVGSRRVPGGGVEQWPLSRRVISRVAGLLARGLTTLRDPTSGYFLFRREILDGVRLAPVGYKICLEVVVRTRSRAVREIPIVFRDRTHGRSKLGSGVTADYLRHLWSLYRWRYGGGR